MINLDEYRDKFERRCLAAGLTKLDKPIGTDEFIYCVFEIQGDAEKDFEHMFFELAVRALIKCIIEEDNSEFYQLSMTRKGNVFSMASSRNGNLSKKVS